MDKYIRTSSHSSYCTFRSDSNIEISMEVCCSGMLFCWIQRDYGSSISKTVIKISRQYLHICRYLIEYGYQQLFICPWTICKDPLRVTVGRPT